MSKKNLMIMGAGIYQVPLIQKAKEMGYRTIVISIPGDYPGLSLADKVYHIDTRAREQVLAAARRENIVGICTSGTDVAVRTVGYVCTRMGLCGISEEAARLVTDKALMKEAFRENGVSTAAFCRVATWEEAEEAADRIGYPVVVKAVDSSGSRGVVRVNRREALCVAFEEARSVTRRDYVLIEEFIDAREIGVDGYVDREGTVVLFPHGKFTYTAEDTTIPVGHSFPYAAGEKLLRELELQMNRAVRALKLRNCPLNADVFVKDDKVWIIEIGGRTGATCIPELLSVYTGYDWYETIIDAAVGKSVILDSIRRTPCMAKLIFSPKEDEIAAIDAGVLEKLRVQGIVCSVDYGVGHVVPAMKNGTARIGHLIAAVSQEAELDVYVSEMRKAIRLKQGTLQEIWKAYAKERETGTRQRVKTAHEVSARQNMR